MQRRFTIAFVVMAIVSIVLLGSGVLALSQLDARRVAETEMADRLELFAETSAEAASRAELARNFNQAERFYGLSELSFYSVDEDGDLSQQRQNRNRNSSTSGAARDRRLSDDKLNKFLAGEPVFLSDNGAVTGLIRLSLENTGPRLDEGSQLAALASEPLPTIRGQGPRWYLISAAIVLLLSVLVAWLLARRLSQPIRDIQLATAQIAKGRLDTRVTPRSSDEVGQLAESVNQMAADLQRSKALDRQFLMSVSHDLRTPLTAMKGYGEALIDGTVDNPGQAGEVIVHHADRLNRLVTDIIELARLDANTFQLHLETASVSVIAERTVAGLQEAASQRDVSLKLDASGETRPVAVDVDRVGQVITNLVHNALKYAETSVVVVVRDEDAETVTLAVVDDGPGIDPTDLPHIFERLYTAKNAPKVAENSSGLGLAIVHELVEAMGGTITATSSLGQGTEMKLRLPTKADRSD